MSYFENRPAVVDVDADVELVATCVASDERGAIVDLTVRERGPAAKVLELQIKAADWRAFARAVAAELRQWEGRDG